MAWELKSVHELTCDLCGHTYEDQDTGATILFAPDEDATHYGWHHVTCTADDCFPPQRDYCPDCWENELRGDAAGHFTDGKPGWQQTGPDLLGGEQP